jgi:hypothetical protein
MTVLLPTTLKTDQAHDGPRMKKNDGERDEETMNIKIRRHHPSH